MHMLSWLGKVKQFNYCHSNQATLKFFFLIFLHNIIFYSHGGSDVGTLDSKMKFA